MDCFVFLSVSCSLRSDRVIFGLTRRIANLIVHYFCDWRGGVKFVFLREGGLRVGRRWMNAVRNGVKRGRSGSIMYEIAGICDSFTGEDFQNTGTFMVVRSSVFSRCSAHKVQLARDAYYAC